MTKASHLHREGFTLVELMVVVVLIGLTIMLAVPSMSAARHDRTVYEYAGSIAQLVRNARARSMGRGGAVVLQFSNASGSRGTYLVYDAVTANSDLTTANTDAGLANLTPDSRCKRGAIDLSDTASNVLVESVVLGSAADVQADILSLVVNAATGVTAPSGGIANMCFTPTGRTYYAEGATPNFDAAVPMTTPISVVLRRNNAAGGSTSPDFGLRRRVLIMPNGTARVITGGT